MRSIQAKNTQLKWYISTALIFIAVLGGILGKQQVAFPNQEIVLQFANKDISLNEAQSTIALVENELKDIGVTYIRIGEQEDGRLVISYHSDTDVESIKNILLTQKELALGFVSDKNEPPLQFPSNDKYLGYNLDVYEIQDGQNLFTDLGGKCAVELKSGQLRFVNPNFYIATNDLCLIDNGQILKENYSFQRYIAIEKEYRAHKIPEVRAGPLS